MEFIDIGANLTNRSLMKDLDGGSTRAADASVRQIVVTGTNLDESSKAIELCHQYPDQLVCTVGRGVGHEKDLEPVFGIVEGEEAADRKISIPLSASSIDLPTLITGSAHSKAFSISSAVSLQVIASRSLN